MKTIAIEDWKHVTASGNGETIGNSIGAAAAASGVAIATTGIGVAVE